MSQMSKEYKAAWYQANKERLKELRRVRDASNRKSVNESLARYRLANPEKIKKIQSSYQKRNSSYYASKCAERYAKKTRATPKWANDFFIKEIYHLAALRTKLMGYPWHVDHIVPLRSPTVCGLHVENNLRVIPATDNYKKRNVSWPEMP